MTMADRTDGAPGRDAPPSGSPDAPVAGSPDAPVTGAADAPVTGAADAPVTGAADAPTDAGATRRAPSPEPPDGGPQGGRRTSGRTTALNRTVVAVLCALLGFAVVLQVQRTAAGDNLETARPDDLVQILDGLQRREDDLNAEIADLQATLAKLQRSGASSEEALAEAQRQAAALGVLTGTAPATGPGVTITIADPDGRVPPEVLLDALQELRNAGAEAFQVGNVRIGVDSAFTGTSGAITLDGVALTPPPYKITAIGDPPTLAAALAIPGGVFDNVRRAGGTMDVSQSDKVVIDALRQPQTPQFARPVS